MDGRYAIREEDSSVGELAGIWRKAYLTSRSACLLRQNQFSSPCDSQPVDLTPVSNQDFRLPAEQIFGPNNPQRYWRISLLRWMIGFASG